MDREGLKNAGIDVDSGLRRFMNNEALFEKFLVKFIDNELMAEIEEKISSGNPEEIFQSAHAFKGVCGNLSLSGILEHLEPMVEILRGGSMDGVPELYEEVKKAYQIVIEEIRRL